MDHIFFENVIIKFLFTDIEMRDKIFPYLNTKIFDDKMNIDIIKKYIHYYHKYESFPTISEMKLEIENKEIYNHLMEIKDLDITEFKHDFLLSEIEDFFKKKLILGVITDTAENLTKDEIDKVSTSPDILREAIAFSFDTKIGLDFLNEPERIYNELHNKDKIIPSGITTLDRFIKGGFHEKSLNLFMAECVDKNTKIRVRIRKKDNFSIKKCVEFLNEKWIYKTIKLFKVKKLLKNYLIEVDSPDGWVSIQKYIEKGKKQAFQLSINNKKILSSENHLYETNNGWKLVKDLNNNEMILCDDKKFHNFKIKKLNKKIEVVDIEVDHPNHRYYTNGVSSHNTNLGKSLIMCSLATNSILQNKNVLYISLEMSEIKLAERILANLFDKDINDISELDKDSFFNLFGNWRKKLDKNLMIKEFPTKSINANHIRNLTKEIKIKKKFLPDIIYLDYLSIMNSVSTTRNDNTYTEIKRISEEIRGLAVELGIPIISAVQTNRGGFGESEIDLTDIADSIGTTATADLIIGVTQPDEFRNLNKFCWMILKNRYGLNRRKMSVIVDYFKMRISDDPEDLNNRDIPVSSEKDKENKINQASEITNDLINKDYSDKFKKSIDFE
ncbi:MAG: DnaB-like helicase C-terminal domain-containing protein [Candidatus Woesearchaeota archaeon]